MPRVSFTSSLRRHVECEAEQVEGATVAEALGAVFAKNTTPSRVPARRSRLPARARGRRFRRHARDRVDHGLALDLREPGDGWTAVSQHLPPVYAVRFG